jgi:hypothetical protein
MDPTAPFNGHTVHFESGDDPIDVLGALGLQGFLSGEEPVAVARRLQRVKPDATLVPPGIEPSRQVFGGQARRVLATGPGWTLVAKVWWDCTAYVTVSAVSRDLAEDVLAAATEGVEEPKTEAADRAEVGFWQMQGHGGRRVERTVDIAPWDAIVGNYTARVAEAVGGLIALDAPPASGRLLLLHGPPGTGKTTILRALAGAWRSWCRVDNVVDPDHLLANPSYLLDVLAAGGRDDEDDEGEPMWRLLVLEDCDELIRAEAKTGTGQSLARLLNVTDGMLGQGSRTLVCITTNEHLGRLHPAVTRPGRCLAQLEVGPLNRAEARAWLGRDLPAGSEGATVAELYAMREGDGPLATAPTDEVPSGVYL